MNRIALRLSLAVAAVFAASAARADSVTTTFQVSANVKKTCTITAQAISVGYDPISANATTDATAEGNLVVACTNKLPYSIGLDSGVNGARKMTKGSDALDYQLYSDAARTSAWTEAATVSGTGQGKQAITHVVYLSIPAGQDAVSASEGVDYTDTVTATVNF
ncbi:MAG TPA: spore coat U domain-containing protein [Anaeromyxobacter sp.]|nr:spore coat U domain-containing protein [Anaeromyxobacter sp.]